MHLHATNVLSNYELNQPKSLLLLLIIGMCVIRRSDNHLISFALPIVHCLLMHSFTTSQSLTAVP